MTPPDPVQAMLPAAAALAVGDPRHGTPAGYRDDRCKCTPCKAAIAKEHNVYKMRRAANGGPLLVPKLGSVRRLQALMALGWSRRELARRAGYRGDAFALILNNERSSLTLATARRVDDLYDLLSMTHGPSRRSREHAKAAGWAPPLAWNDIDDPDENPTGWQHTPATRAEELAELDAMGLGVSQVAARLGTTAEALERWCLRHGYGSVWSRLLGRETPVRRVS